MESWNPVKKSPVAATASRMSQREAFRAIREIRS
jgi:hypothetical protein